MKDADRKKLDKLIRKEKWRQLPLYIWALTPLWIALLALALYIFKI